MTIDQGPIKDKLQLSCSSSNFHPTSRPSRRVYQRQVYEEQSQNNARLGFPGFPDLGTNINAPAAIKTNSFGKIGLGTG